MRLAPASRHRERGDHLVDRAGGAVLAQLGGLPADGGGAALELAFVCAAADHERGGVGERGGSRPMASHAADPGALLGELLQRGTRG